MVHSVALHMANTPACTTLANSFRVVPKTGRRLQGVFEEGLWEGHLGRFFNWRAFRVFLV
jgi:hypothetical protein